MWLCLAEGFQALAGLICSPLDVSFGSLWFLFGNFGGYERDLEMDLEGLIVLSSGHPKGLGVDVQPVSLTMMTAAYTPQEGKRGCLSPSTPICQCPGTNKRISRKVF